MKVTENHKKLLKYMHSEVAWNYADISDETEIKIPDLRRLMVDLRMNGYCFLTNLMTCEGLMHGSGWILTDEGVGLQKELGIESELHGMSC